MRVVIIPSDSTVQVDGRNISGLNLSWISTTVHAVVWHGTVGEEQIVDANGRIVENRLLESLAAYQPALDAWEAARAVLDAPPPEPSLEERRAAVWEQIKAERSRRENGGALAGGHWFQTDSDSRIKVLRLEAKAVAALAAGGAAGDVLTVAGQPIYWKTTENGLVPMTVSLAQEIMTGIEVLDALAYTRAEVLRAQVMASADPEAIDLTTGWPPVYGG